jgi:hypothetical protein
MTVILSSDVTSIVVGQSITFNVVIPAADIPDPFVSDFAGGVANFLSGDGQGANVFIGQSGGGNVTFTYLRAGDYVASTSGDVLYATFCGSFHQTCPGVGAGSMDFNATENVTVSVPEPATWLLLATVLFFCTVWRQLHRSGVNR